MILCSNVYKGFFNAQCSNFKINVVFLCVLFSDKISFLGSGILLDSHCFLGVQMLSLIRKCQVHNFIGYFYFFTKNWFCCMTYGFVYN